MTNKLTFWLAWVLCTFVLFFSLWGVALSLGSVNPPAGASASANAILNGLMVIAFGIVGALIVSRQPHNSIGWLFMLMGISLALAYLVQPYLEQSLAFRGINPAPGPALNGFTYLLIWFSIWNWWLLMGPLMLILLIFPTGRLLTPRWRWAAALVVFLFITFLIIATLTPTWNLPNSNQSVPNPLVRLPVNNLVNTVLTPWELTLMSTVVLCVSAVFIRYKRANTVEREQLKWFFYACAIFIVVYVVGYLDLAILNPQQSPDIFAVFFDIVLLFLPVSIGIAILRYRLFDIDIIIRRTLSYSLLTALLALFYFGSVVILQEIFHALTGSGSDAAVILSTLVIAVLFNPLRRRLQNLIDQRFYRRKYDADHAVATFGITARDEVEREKLANSLVSTLVETMQPERVSLWLKK